MECYCNVILLLSLFVADASSECSGWVVQTDGKFYLVSADGCVPVHSLWCVWSRVAHRGLGAVQPPGSLVTSSCVTAEYTGQPGLHTLTLTRLLSFCPTGIRHSPGTLSGTLLFFPPLSFFLSVCSSEQFTSCHLCLLSCFLLCSLNFSSVLARLFGFISMVLLLSSSLLSLLLVPFNIQFPLLYEYVIILMTCSCIIP